MILSHAYCTKLSFSLHTHTQTHTHTHTHTKAQGKIGTGTHLHGSYHREGLSSTDSTAICSTGRHVGWRRMHGRAVVHGPVLLDIVLAFDTRG